MNPIPWPWRARPRGGEGRGEADSGETIGGAPLVPLSVASNVRKFWERALIMEDEYNGASGKIWFNEGLFSSKPPPSLTHGKTSFSLT